MSQGKLYLIPCPIAEGRLSSLSADVAKVIRILDHFMVERARTSRRFIKALCPEITIGDLAIFELDKNNPRDGVDSFLSKLKEGINIGILSEAGCPGVADPGNVAVQYCHKYDIEVVPLVGPSSILLALMSSGMNGQNFAFNGYLSIKKPELIKKLKSLEQIVRSQNQTQLFMDAPYRNTFLLESCIAALSDQTLLGVACDLDDDTASIKVQTIKAWKQSKKDQYHKRPAIFMIGRY